MATKSFTKPDKGPKWQVYSWAGVTEADTCAPVKVEPAMFAYSMQTSGTFGSATVSLHGSIDGTNYVALKDATGTAISATAAGIVSGGQIALYLKPVATGGSSQSLTFTLMVGYQP